MSVELPVARPVVDEMLDPVERIAELELQLERVKQDRDDIARMGAVLTSIIDLEEVLSLLMQMSLRVIGAEVGLILTTGPAGLKPRIIWGFDPRAIPLLQYRDGENVVEWAVRTGEGVVADYSDRTAGLAFEGRHLMVGGVIALPIRAKREIVGCVVVVNKCTGEPFSCTGEPFSEDDRDLMQMLVDFAGVAIENARLLAESLEKQRLEQELSLAEEVQKTLVPAALALDVPDTDIKLLYRPAGKVGGDYFDIIPCAPGQFVLVIGDVSNKGVPAALLMAAVRSIVRSEVRRSASTAEVVTRVNEVVSADLTGHHDMFITLFYGVFDLNRQMLTYTNAGHPPPLLHPANSHELVELAQGGVFLGQFPGTTFQEGRQPLGPGDRLLAYTDGIIEAADAAGRLFGRERLKTFMIRHADIRPEEFLERLKRELENNFANADYKDDMTVVFAQLEMPGGRRGAGKI